MSGQDKHRQEDTDATPPSPAQETDKSKPEPAKPGLKYVFKISPADPKRNSIDFEDVADK